MIALLDLGNTTIAIGVSFEGKEIDRIYRLNTEKTKSADEYAITLNQFLKNVQHVVISSVVPELNSVFKEYFEKEFEIKPVFLGYGVKTGLKITTDNPKEVGADIIANAVAATSLYDRTCLVIDLGTATTMTYVEEGNLRGVVIAPGLTTSKNALISKTSQLPQVELEAPKKLIGTNSVDSIKSGLVYGHASMLEGMISRIRLEVGKPDLRIVLTGGHAKMIAPLVGGAITMDERLILKGLLQVYRKNIS
ncbi:MAG: type III pantothenate kinase [Candidatus Izemoplasmatales bacterium]|nr:type III pantothenate kinase [Candidatus Izemoplasmatales bacterium]